MALFVEKPVGLWLILSDLWDDGFGLLGPDDLEDGIAVIGAIGEHGLGLNPVDQAERSWRIACQTAFSCQRAKRL